MTAVSPLGTGDNADAVIASPAATKLENDIENGENQPVQVRFGDQSSRLPRAKIISVSMALLRLLI
jgi:hypothetical protein